MPNITKQILEAQARNSDQACHLLMESLPDGVFVMDAHRRIILANAAAERLARAGREKLLGADFADFFPGIKETPLFRALKRVIRTRHPETVYAQFVLENGRPGWCAVWLHSVPGGVAAVIRALGQEAVGAVASASDPETEDQAPGLDSAPRTGALWSPASRQRLERILNTACQFEHMDCGGIYLFDEETGGLVLALHHGLSPRFVDCVASYEHDSTQVRIISEGKPIYTRFETGEALSEEVRATETLRGVAIIPIRQQDKVIGSLHVASHTLDDVPRACRPVLESLALQIGDAMAHGRVEEALRESEKRYRDLYDNMRDGVAAVDMNGWVTECNAAFLKMVGYSREELFRLTYQDLTPPKWHHSEARIMAEQVLARGYSQVYEKEYIRKDGTTFPVELRTSLMRYETGAPKGMWAVVRDITERKRAEDRVRTLSHELLRVQEKERRRISRDLHDQLAQDLAGLKMGLRSLLTAHPSLPDELHPKVDLLLERLQESIQYVRELSYALHPSGLEHFGLAQTVRAYCEDFENKTGLKVAFETIGAGSVELGPDVSINLFRVIQEGLRNVELHAHARAVKLRLQLSRKEALLRLEDDGAGFNVRQRESSAISEKRMGLRGMRERVALMGGKIRIGSRRGKGSTIHVRVPLALDESLE